MHQHSRIVICDELRNPSDSVADDIVQKLSRELSNPVLFIGEQSLRVPFAHFVAIITLHIGRRAAEISALDECSHATGGMSELIVVAGSYLEAFPISQPQQFLRIRSMEREGLFNVNMATGVEALLPQGEMILRGSCEMDDVRPCRLKQFTKISKPVFHSESFGQLPGHQFFLIADRNNLTILDPANLRDMRIGNLAAPDDSHLKHFALSPCTPENN